MGPVDEPRAARLYRRSCEADNGFGCLQLGMYRRLGNGNLEVDGERADAYFRKACNHGNMMGCAWSHDPESD